MVITMEKHWSIYMAFTPAVMAHKKIVNAFRNGTKKHKRYKSTLFDPDWKLTGKAIYWWNWHPTLKQPSKFTKNTDYQINKGSNTVCPLLQQLSSKLITIIMRSHGFNSLGSPEVWLRHCLVWSFSTPFSSCLCLSFNVWRPRLGYGHYTIKTPCKVKENNFHLFILQVVRPELNLEYHFLIP